MSLNPNMDLTLMNVVWLSALARLSSIVTTACKSALYLHSACLWFVKEFMHHVNTSLTVKLAISRYKFVDVPIFDLLQSHEYGG
jgi:hypothetical protein